MAQAPRVCVIGAGSSGIASCQVLHARGIQFDCFEKGSGVGGNWRYINDNGHVVGVRVAVDQHLAPDHGVRDLPDAGGLPGLPAPPPDRRLLRRLRGPLRLPRPDPLQDRGHPRRARADGPGGTSTLGRRRRPTTYEAVFVANGHHWDPRWPEPDFPGEFARRGHPRPLLQDARRLRGQERARARASATRPATSPSRPRGSPSDLPGHAPRRVDHPQVLRLDAASTRCRRSGSARACRSRSSGCACMRRSSATRATRPTSGCRSPTTSSPRPTRPSRPTCCRGSATAGSRSSRTSSG